MQLRVIGCSPAWPNPGGAHSGYLVEVGDTRLLLDCGPGVLGRLRAAGLIAVDAIAISHLHLDHWGDLVPWVWFSAHGNGGGGRPMLLVPPGGAGELGAFAERFGQPGMFSAAFDLSEYEPERASAIGALELEPIAVDHYGFPAFGFRIRDGAGRVLGYSGDTGPCAGLERISDGADLLLCEATLRDARDDASPRGHLSAEEALAFADGRVLLTHRPDELGTPPRADRAVEGLSVEV